MSSYEGTRCVILQINVLARAHLRHLTEETIRLPRPRLIYYYVYIVIIQWQTVYRSKTFTFWKPACDRSMNAPPTTSLPYKYVSPNKLVALNLDVLLCRFCCCSVVWRNIYMNSRTGQAAVHSSSVSSTLSSHCSYATAECWLIFKTSNAVYLERKN